MLSALHHTDIHIEMLPTICVFAVCSSAIHLSMKKTCISLSLHEESIISIGCTQNMTGKMQYYISNYRTQFTTHININKC